METAAQQIDITDLRTIEGLVSENPEVLNVSLLQWQLRHRDQNGLNNAVVKVGKRVLISKTRYQQWLSAQAGK